MVDHVLRIPVAEPGRSTKVGNIRWGGRHPTRGTPQTHDHFRVTSPTRAALEHVADGMAEVTVWDRSAEGRQDEFEVHLPTGHQLQVTFEVSTANFRSGFELGLGSEWRWCDGRTAYVRSEPEGGDDSGGREEMACICAADIAAGRSEELACKRNTVMRVRVPGVEGHWLLAGGSRLMQEAFSGTMQQLWSRVDEGQVVPITLEVTQHDIPMRGGKRRRGWLPSLTVRVADADEGVREDSDAYKVLAQVLEGASLEELSEWRAEFTNADEAGELSHREKKALVEAAAARHTALQEESEPEGDDLLTPADLPF